MRWWLEDKLERIKQEKAAWIQSQRQKDLQAHKGYNGTSTNSQGGPGNPDHGHRGQSSTPLAPTSQGVVPKKTEAVIDCEEEMYQTPGRKTRRADEAPENLKYNQRGNQDEKDHWSLVSSPPGSNPS